MEKIVYILGAGFSAPLGLPVMRNFLEKSKDQYFAAPNEHTEFQEIFAGEMRQIHIASDYYQTNVFNIEDILSILEFRARLDNSEDGKERLDRFIRYLKDVIKYYTPLAVLKDNPHTLFPESKWNDYIRFIAGIMGCSFQHNNVPDQPSHLFSDPGTTSCQYSVITFNYDVIIENVETHLKHFGSPRYFHKSIELADPVNQIRFAKLHGSIDGEIVPPTWNKTLNDHVLTDWKVAYRALTEANQIRILGYSLPHTDSYFRYLLRAAIIDTPNLKTIDVICKDDTGSVKESYDEFVKTPNYRFLSAKIEDYLEFNRLLAEDRFIYFSLESGHANFFNPRIREALIKQ